MKKFKFLFIPVFLGLVAFYGCSEDDPAVNEAEVLVQYLESADSPFGKDYLNTSVPKIVKSSDVYNALISPSTDDDYYVIDIRSATDYAAGHIEGAENVSHKEILNHLEAEGIAKDAMIAVVCYSGQTAGWATSIINLMGYVNAASMKWGMCSWASTTTTSWDNNYKNTYATQITKDGSARNEAGSLPALSTGKSTGQEILEARVQAVLAEGFDAAKVSNSAVWDAKESYHIVNYWSEAHYNDPGHIPTAQQYTPKADLALDAALKTLATDKPVAVYCYTGQTSAFTAAYLRILGYDAKSILFGTNGMFYDKCVEAQMTVWSEAEKHDYPLVTD
jgi:rhodanese-related sulfurtransferase